MPAIIFDFDGVIVDSEPVHEAALRAALRDFGLDFSPEEYRRRFIGYCDRAILEIVATESRRALNEADMRFLTARKWTLMQEQIEAGAVRPYPNSLELLRAAAAHGPVAICSGALRHEIDAILQRCGVAGVVSTIVSADDTPASKPDPAPYRLVTARLGLSPAECVTIEDTAKGVRSAKEAGVRVVAVCHSMTAAELSEADVVVNSTAEVNVDLLLDVTKARA